MALTVTTIYGPVSVGDRFKTVATVAADTSYPTGGWSLTPAQLGMSSAADAELDVSARPMGGYVAEYVHSTQKLKLYSSNGVSPNALLEVPNATNVSAAVGALRVEATSKLRG